MSLIRVVEVLSLYEGTGCSIEYDGTSKKDFESYLERPFYEIVGDMNTQSFERATTFDFNFDLIHEKRGRKDVLLIRKRQPSE